MWSDCGCGRAWRGAERRLLTAARLYHNRGQWRAFVMATSIYIVELVAIVAGTLVLGTLVALAVLVGCP
jgi:hypothetical protein